MNGDAPALGQYFTPPAIVELALDLIGLFGGELAGARVIDPACGPGAWLRASLKRGAEFAVGLDCDPEMISRWVESGLLADGALLCVADGLTDITGSEGAFDVVVGNPPFGADLRCDGTEALRALGRCYHLHRGASAPRERREPTRAEMRRLARFPTEVLFIERFVQLCAPGGWIAVVLPEGIFANQRWRYVREWLLERVTVQAVVALPRATFREDSTTARTCLLVARNIPPAAGHRVTLAELKSCETHALETLLDHISRGGDLPTDTPDGLDPPPILRDRGENSR